MGLFLKARQVHTHEPDRLPVTDRTDFLHRCTVASQRNLELVPRHFLRTTVSQRHTTDLLLRDMLTTHLHHVGTKDHFVLVVLLVLVEGVIEVDIFDIRIERRSRSVTLCLLFGGR